MSILHSSDLAALIWKYDRLGPRYTSYPTALEFNEGVGPGDYLQRLAQANEQADKHGDVPWAVYVHLPFCESRCSFCGCNVIILHDRRYSAPYLANLRAEFALIASQAPRRRRVSQFHLGGGTPNFQTPEELEELVRSFFDYFEVAPGAELACEIDPRTTRPEHLEKLRALGFNRVSMGVQDFTPEVQEIVRRGQTEEQTREVYRLCRQLGFPSINMDLIYGLPKQTLDTFDRNLSVVCDLRPDRLAVYSFAHVPWLRSNQKLLDPKMLPPPEVKIELFCQAMRRFLAAGYRKIGMDHFALPEDELARALDRGALYRNFMGYTILPPGDTLAFGISGIGDVQGGFFQNTKKLNRYHDAIESGAPPIERGYLLTEDDKLRRRIIMDLMCNFRVDFGGLEREIGFRAEDTLGPELEELAGLEAEGFVRREGRAFHLTELGTLFVRNVAMVFDAHLRRKAGDQPRFSRTV